jgi:UDP-3-O-[3-hydroxymyristoyl] glucosamine N-acyltransferase
VRVGSDVEVGSGVFVGTGVEEGVIVTDAVALGADVFVMVAGTVGVAEAVTVGV